MAELGNASAVSHKDLGSNLDMDRKKFLFCLFYIWIQICFCFICTVFHALDPPAIWSAFAL
jgi:hypothetical protein